MDFDVDISGRDHAFENIYHPASLENGNPRYGMTVRADAWPEHLRARSMVRTFQDRVKPMPLPVIGEDPYILVAGVRKPKVDWRRAGSMRLLAELVAEARLRNQSDDWAFRNLALNLQGVAFEIGSLDRYKDARAPLPPGFKADTLIYAVHKVTLI